MKTRNACYYLLCIYLVQWFLFWRHTSIRMEIDDQMTYSADVPYLSITTRCHTLSTHSDYIIMCNYRPHLNLDPSITNYSSINHQTLSGVLHRMTPKDIDNMNALDLSQYFAMCNKWIDCIGIAIHPTAGIFFHNHSSIPLQHVRQWNFYINRNINHTNDAPTLHIERLRNYKVPLKRHEIDNVFTYIIPRSYISFGWNSGGPNNQIMSLAYMLRYCVAYQRTLIIPFQTTETQFIGLMKHMSLWDLHKLSEICDYIFEQEIDDEQIHLLRFRELEVNVDSPFDETLFTPCDIDQRTSYKIHHDLLNTCSLIHVRNGKYGILRNYLNDIYGLYQYIIPHPYIRNAVQSAVTKHFNANTNRYRIGVFRRTIKQPDGEHVDEKTKQPYYCRAWKIGVSHGSGQWSKLLRKTIQNNQYLMAYNDGQIKSKLLGIFDLYDRTCAMRWDDLQQTLQFHRQNRIDIEGNERWFLASDWEEAQEVEKQWVDRFNAVTIVDHGVLSTYDVVLPSLSVIDWSQSHAFGANDVYDKVREMVQRKYLKYLEANGIKDGAMILEDWSKASEIEYWRKEQVLFNMWMLAKSDFFISSWFSTVTVTICRWRGKENRYKSSTCYLRDKWREAHEPPWFDIDAITTPQLPWNK
eukprot:268006_1